MKIIVCAGFPYGKGEDGECEGEDNLIHAEQQGDVLLVSKELLESVKKYLLESQGFIVFHRDHSTVYSSTDRKDKH